mgnify:CR=1 FL=1
MVFKMRKAIDRGYTTHSEINKKVLEMLRRDIEGVRVEGLDIVEIVKNLEEVREKYQAAKNYYERLRDVKRMEIEQEYREACQNARDIGFIQKAQKDRARAYLALDLQDQELIEARQKTNSLKEQKDKLERIVNAFIDENKEIIEEVKKEQLKQDIIKAGLLKYGG